MPHRVPAEPVGLHQGRLRRQGVTGTQLPGLDHPAQDRRQLLIQRGRVETIYCHGPELTQALPHSYLSALSRTGSLLYLYD